MMNNLIIQILVVKFY